ALAEALRHRAEMSEERATRRSVDERDRLRRRRGLARRDRVGIDVEGRDLPKVLDRSSARDDVAAVDTEGLAKRRYQQVCGPSRARRGPPAGRPQRPPPM